MKHCIHRPKSLRRIIACLMALCLAVPLFVLNVIAPSYAADNFSGKSPFSHVDYSSYIHNGRFAGNLIVNGVDVSNYQSKSCNWAAAKTNGVDYAILRVTWTGYSKTKFSYKNNDAAFEDHYKKAKAAGVMVGAYVFSQAKTEDEARKEASNAIARLNALGITPKDMDLPIYMDYEFAGGSSGRLYKALNKTNGTACAKAFCETIRKAGYQPGIYASKSFYDNYINHDALGSDVDFWVAQYNNQCTYGPSYTKWQYSSKGYINGILSSSTNKVGNTDVDFWYIDKTAPGTGKLDIYGSQDVKYTGSAVKPNLQIYNKNTLLKGGTDYTINGITNVKEGTAYAYIRGIGKYSGYAVVPFNISSKYAARADLPANVKLESAKLSNTEYLVRFISDGKEVSSQYVEEGTAIANLKLPKEPMKSANANFGYEFNGWAIANHATKTKVDESITFVATFKKVPKSGGSATGVEVNEKIPSTSKALSRKGSKNATECKLYEDAGRTWVNCVSSGITADTLLNSVAFVSGTGKGMTMKVINSDGSAVGGSTKVKSGMMVGIYSGSTLKGTAEIIVSGDTLNSVSADYIK